MAIDPADRKFFQDPAATAAESESRLAQPESGQTSTLEEEFGEPFFWQEAVVDRINTDIANVAQLLNLDLLYAEGWFNGQKVNLLNYLTDTAEQLGPALDLQTPNGVRYMLELARLWVGERWPGFTDALRGKGAPPPRGGGRGRGNIRDQFDLDELTSAVNQMARGLLLAEASNARQIAKTYVNLVANNPEKRLDFKTFVRERLLETPRAKLIYANKPESMSHEEFLQPYVNAAAQMIGPGFGTQRADLSINAARLGASPGAFAARLSRTRQVQSSSPFMERLGQRLARFGSVLR